MKEVILTKGLPGSGKSYWAKSMLDKFPGKYKIVCKDDIRAMLDNGRFSHANERFVVKIRNMIISQILQNGQSVIAADTNLNDVHELDIRKLVDDSAEVKIQDFTKVPLEVCIENDLKRFTSVGEAVIRGMYMQYLHEYPAPQDSKLPRALVVDLDGTLAIHRGRSPYEFERCGEDEVNPAVLSVLHRFKSTHTIIFLSGRDDSCRKLTEDWLEFKAGIKVDKLYMRTTKDSRKDSIVKSELYENFIKDKYHVDFVLDDRDQVVAMWRRLGISTFQVNYGAF